MTENVKTNKYTEISQKYGDPWIWGIYLMLVVISIIESYSASSREISTKGLYLPLIMQLVYLAGGAVCIFVLMRSRYNSPSFLYLMVPVLALFTVFCLIYVLKFGTDINGARRAMTIIPGLLTIQPAEFAKLSIVTMLSYIFAKSQKNHDISNKGLFGAAVVVAVYGGLMISSGLTNTLLLIAISGSMLLIGGARLKKILYLMGFFAVMFAIFLVIKSMNDKTDEAFRDSQKERIANKAPGDEALETVPAGDNKPTALQRSGTWKSRVHEWW